MLTPTEAIWKRWNLYSTKTPAACSESMYMQVLYHLQKVSGKSGWKVNGIRLFGLLRGQRNILKGSPVLPDGMFQTEIRVPFLQSRLWYQFQAFAAVFWQIELIWANGKRDSGKKFITPELRLPFTLTVNRPVNNRSFFFIFYFNLRRYVMHKLCERCVTITFLMLKRNCSILIG